MEENPAVYYRIWGNDNIAYGPIELPAVAAWIRQGRIQPATWIFREERGEWRVAEVTELKGLFKSEAGDTQATPAAHGITPGALRRIKILAEMDERQLTSFLQYMEMLKFPPNATVCSKGEHGDAMFFVLQGEVRARVLIDGRESTLATLGTGECFGEMAVIDEGPRSADVIANKESVLLKFSTAALKRLFQEAPALAAPFLLALSKAIIGRTRTLTKRYEDSIRFARVGKVR